MAVDAASLFAPDRPAVELAELGPVDLYTLRSTAAPGAGVVTLRGGWSRSERGFFQEISAAMQFPEYFGGNWSALDDCLRDYADAPGPGHALVVVTASELLADADPEALKIFLTIAAGADQDWQESSGRRLRVLLTEPIHGLWRLEERLSALSLTVGRADGG